MTRAVLFAIAFLLPSCTTTTPARFAAPEPTGDPLADSALLLAASEAAPDAAAREPFLARLDAAVCSEPFAPAAKCRWLPLFTERYSIELANRGTTPASVYLVFR